VQAVDFKGRAQGLKTYPCETRIGFSSRAANSLQRVHGEESRGSAFKSGRCEPPISINFGGGGSQSSRLPVPEDERGCQKKVSRGRVAIWAEHSHEAAGWDGCRIFESPKAHRGVDIVAQDLTARLLVAGEHQLDRFTKQRLREPRFPLGAFADRFTKVFRQCQLFSPVSSFSGSLPSSLAPAGRPVAGASSCHPQAE
jgi:hypothetical protein